MEPGVFVATLERLWSRSELLLWALATACVVAFVALAVGAHFDPPTFGTVAQSANAWLLPFGVALLVLAGFRTYYEKTRPAVRLVPLEQQFFWHVNKPNDGSVTTQIVGHFEAYNLSDSPIVLIDIKPIKPKITGQFIARAVDVQDVHTVYSGRYPIPAHMRVDGSFHLIAIQDFSSRGAEMDITVRISDQFGRRYKLAVRRVPKR